VNTGIHWLDWTVIAGYFALIIAVGVAAARRVKHSSDFFLGSRRFNVWMMLGQSFGVGTHAEMPVSLAGAVYRTGYSAIWFQWKNIFITPFYWMLAPLFRRFRRTTLGEVYEDRYGHWMGAVYTVWALLYFIFTIGSMLKGAGKLVSAASGGMVSPEAVVLTMTAAFLLYSVVGGLVAAAWTDFVQSLFIIALSYMLIPLGLSAAGGFTGVRETLDARMLQMVTPGEVGFFTIAMLTLNGLVGIIAQPHMVGAVGTGRDERTCRNGFMYGNFIKRFCTIGWALVGLLVAVLLAQRGGSLADPEEAFGYATRSLLFPGSVGLMIACVLAANMSTCSAMTVDGGALFVKNLYQRYLVRERPDNHYLKAGRVAGILVTLLGVVFAYAVESVLEAFLFCETVAAFMGISLFGAVCWRRANRWGALASLLMSAAVFFAMSWVRFGALLRWDAGNFALCLAAGLMALFLGSRLTAPEDARRVADFYQRLDTPSAFDPETGQEKAVAAPGSELLLVHAMDVLAGPGRRRFWQRFRTDIMGFLAGIAVVAGLVLLAKAILYLP